MTHDDLIDPSVFEELQDAMGDDFAAELLETFLDDAVNMFAELTQAVQAGDTDSYRRASHSLKSNAQTFGATALAEKAREMELSSGIDADAADALSALFQQTKTRLEGLLDE
ncbi:Hpt domain-containing protein [uncultured Tateyamaria sp.]|uniref:Hpt domain-containing protein n=1 Tax=uncultured Tateyamaria sp. TaxID=455651 RepID=UPI002618CA2A|nr:Hpt domain-containing protein [uncultured Tateyamaria sp.]